MTEKEQKILSEITTRKLCTMDEHMAFYNDNAKEDYRFLSEIEELIKSSQEETVSEDLEEEIKTCFLNNTCKVSEISVCSFAAFGRIARHFAEWQKEKMMAKAIRGRVSVNVESNYHRLIYGCWDMDDALENCNEGDRVKVIVIKEERS